MPNELVRLKDPMLRHPDERRSQGRLFFSEIGAKHDYIWAVEVRGQGVIVLRSNGSDPITGRMTVGMSILTDHEIVFGP